MSQHFLDRQYTLSFLLKSARSELGREDIFDGVARSILPTTGIYIMAFMFSIAVEGGMDRLNAYMVDNNEVGYILFNLRLTTLDFFF